MERRFVPPKKPGIRQITNAVLPHLELFPRARLPRARNSGAEGMRQILEKSIKDATRKGDTRRVAALAAELDKLGKQQANAKN